MEQHPVPRNISSFQFRLVGDMTLKQFIYLAGGVVCAFLIIKFFPLPTLLKWPGALIFAFGGLAFAFLPIQERPLDKWLVAFIRSINTPTQYLWHKDSIIPDILARSYSTNVPSMPVVHKEAHEDAKRKLDAYLASIPSTPHQTINTREKNYLNKTLGLFENTVTPNQVIPQGFVRPQTTPTTFPSGSLIRPIKTDIIREVVPTIKSVPIGSAPSDKTDTVKSDVLPVITSSKKNEAAGQTQIQGASPTEKPVNIPAPVKTVTEAKTANPDMNKIEEKQINPPAATITKPIPTASPAVVQSVKTATPVTTPPTEEKEKLKSIIEEKQKLEAELIKLKEELTKNKQATTESDKSKPNIVKPMEAQEKKEPTIKTITPKTAVNEIGIPRLPQVPNLIMGVIKDMQSKQLPNIILTIKDTKGTPHRALKTNRLGQFSTATPLSNGTYYIEAEDPLKRYVFDIAEIKLEGKVFLPIEIDAKGEKELMREKLTKEIFGNIAATP